MTLPTNHITITPTFDSSVTSMSDGGTAYEGAVNTAIQFFESNFVNPAGGDVDNLRAQIVSLTEANRLLIAAQQDLLDADRATNAATDKYRAVARNYLDALAQFMTPGNLGELADQL